MRNLKMELVERFGMDGNGKIDTEVSVEEFEAWFGVKLDKRISNEYDTEDCRITIDENDDDFKITIEIKDEIITHCYY